MDNEVPPMCPTAFNEKICFVVSSNRTNNQTWYIVVSNTNNSRHDGPLPRVSRSEASNICKNISAKLATILSKNEDDIIAKELNRQYQNVSLALNRVWIGLKKIGKKKTVNKFVLHRLFAYNLKCNADYYFLNINLITLT